MDNIAAGFTPSLLGQPITLLDATGKRPLKRVGRPLNEDRTDMTNEYTVGDTASRYSGINTGAQLERLLGAVDDMDVTLGWQAKDQMDNDAFCAAALDTLILGATARGMEVDPASKALYLDVDDEAKANEVAAFIRRCLMYLRGTHRDINLTAFQLARQACKIGHSKAEIVKDLRRGGRDDMKRVITRIKSKSRYNSSFVVDRQNNIVGIAGFTGNYDQNYQNPYGISGMSSAGYIQASQLSFGWKLIDRAKWLVITCRPPADDSPLGTSLYRRAYSYCRMKRDTWAMYLKSLDNTAQPFGVAEMPEAMYAQDVYPLDSRTGLPLTTATKVPAAYGISQAIKIGRQAGHAVVPHGTKYTTHYTAQSGDPFSVARGIFNSEITQAILLQALATTESRHMARAAGQVHQDVLDIAMRHFRRMICDAITRDVFTELVTDNFTQDYWHLIPNATMGDVELNDVAAWADALSKMATAGLLYPQQFPHIWALLGLPQIDLDDLFAQVAQDQALIAAINEGDPAAGDPAVQDTTNQTTANAGTKVPGSVKAAQKAVAPKSTQAAVGGAQARVATAQANVPKVSQMQKFYPQELGKRLTRDAARKTAGRVGPQI